MSMNPEKEASISTCGNCRSPMPAGLRFCRNCGFRLGEGSAEYTETVRFQNAPPGTLPGNNAPNSGPYGFAGGPMAAARGGAVGKRRRRMSGTTWMFIGLLIFFITAGVLTAIVKQVRPRIAGGGPIAPSFVVSKSYVGVDEFETAEGDVGVTFANVEPADGPADKAGLVGGDIITSIDGQAVRTDDEASELMKHIPIGKTVEIVYVRDGETRNTKLTTISKAELDQLNEIYEQRPEGEGLFGYSTGDAERVPIPNTKKFGIKLGELTPNRPADMAGIKAGDIVLEFGGVPIRTRSEFIFRVQRAKPYETVDVVVIRDGAEMKIPVKMGKDN
ncbi:MAG TPA: PDZ domain-containing protein [Pyrinomonadaceae bacterium]|jgi:S1-C subfamily serine protease|nr:PDZ domain-containing protein [Pyrinomonadaceae bacterium]